MIPPQFDCAWPFPKGEDRAMVAVGEQIAFIDPTGAVVFRSRYIAMDPFSEGRAVFVDLTDHQAHGDWTWGFLDRSGREVTRAHVDRLGPLLHGLAVFAVRREGGNVSGYVDADGGVVIPPRFRTAYNFDERGLAAVCEERCGFIDVRGAWALPPRFDWTMPFEDGIARVGRNGGDAFIDQAGVELPPTDERIAGRPYSEGVEPRRDLAAGFGLVGYVDRQGTIVIPPRFFEAGHFHDGIAPAAEPLEPSSLESGEARPHAWPKWGYIDRKGDWVVPPRYGLCLDVHDHVGRAWRDFPEGEATSRSPPDAPVADYIDPSGGVIGRLECAKRWQ